jgi:PAS domain S-box-containing protein
MSSTVAVSSGRSTSHALKQRAFYAAGSLFVLAAACFVFWPELASRILASNYLPHFYCYLGKPALVWTHVIADSLIGLAYVAISGTLAFLVYRARRDIPFHGMFLAFGLFIVACGSTHFMEVVTIWIPVYVLSAAVKVFTAIVSVATAVILPFTVPHILDLIQRAKSSELATALLRESETRIRSITETTPSAIISANAKGCIQYFNPAAERMFGYSAREAVGQQLTLLMPERFHGAHQHGIERFLATRQGHVIGSTAELGGRRKDGGEFPVALALSAWEAGGEIFFTGILQDVTERKRADEGLRLSEKRFSSAFEYAPIGMALVAPDGRWLKVNRALCNLVGYTSDEMLIKTFQDITHPDDLGADLEFVRQMLAGEISTYQMEKRYFHKSGHLAWVLLSVSLVRDEYGQALYFISQIQDITDRKRAEDEIQTLNQQMKLQNAELENINKELESFSYSVSHDLRAPLRAIDGFSLALLEDCKGELCEEGKLHLGRIRAATGRMGHLIEDMLKLARVVRSELIADEVDLTRLSQEVAAQLRDTEPDREVIFDIHPRLNAWGDRHLLRAMLENLLGNAWKFTSKQSVARIEVGIQDNDSAFFVRDNGAGFDMKYANKLFGAFQRLHADREYSGSGIGLATVQRIVRKHGGRIWADAIVGKGATFYFHLPPRYSHARWSSDQGAAEERLSPLGGTV